MLTDAVLKRHGIGRFVNPGAASRTIAGLAVLNLAAATVSS
jgi:hypothetical protein